MKPKVTISCLAYNQHEYIGQALESFIKQKTNFPFEVIVHDDASTDGTTDIIRQYAEKYPDVIKPIFQTENQFSQGVNIEAKFIAPQIRGQYVAICDGDDYWSDDTKLQRQVDFLDRHPDYSICFHKMRTIWIDNSQPESVWPTSRKFKDDNLAKLLDYCFIPSNSVMYRWNWDASILPQKPYQPWDWFRHLMHARYGKIGFIDREMSIYRKWGGGIWEDKDQDKFHIRNGVLFLRFYQAIESIYGIKKTYAINSLVLRTIAAYMRNGMYDKIQEFQNEFGDLVYKTLSGDANAQDNQIYKWRHRFQRMLIIAIILGVFLTVSLVTNIFLI
ncbi:MAG: glycosyltransferase [Muribaculaceae bacterium]|nr:glycosyltransferase [Muribaculaceae bacterium]